MRRYHHAHRHRPLLWPALAGLLTAVVIGEAVVIVALIHYIAVMP